MVRVGLFIRGKGPNLQFLCNSTISHNKLEVNFKENLITWYI